MFQVSPFVAGYGDEVVLVAFFISEEQVFVFSTREVVIVLVGFFTGKNSRVFVLGVGYLELF